MYYMGFEVLTIWTTDWTVWGLNPARGMDFSVLQNVQTSSGAHPASYSMGIRVLSHG
jgi:hypothetical protein